MKTSKMTHLFLISKVMKSEIESMYYRNNHVVFELLSKHPLLVDEWNDINGQYYENMWQFGGTCFTDLCGSITVHSDKPMLVRPLWGMAESRMFKINSCNRGKKRYVRGENMFLNILNEWIQFDAYQGELGDGGIVETCFKTWAKREYPRYAASLVLYKKRKDRNYIDPDDLPF